MKTIPFICTLIVLTLFSCNNKSHQNAAHNTGRFTGAIADSSMVVTAHPLASQVGVEILKKGGNAVDAAVAVHMALTVVYPRAGNIGGGGFMVLRWNDGEINSLDFREKAPKQSERDMYLDENGDVVPRLSIDGHLAVGVPGSVDGCFVAHQKYGKLPWAELIQPAIKLASKGYMLSEVEATYLNDNREQFEKFNQNPLYFIKESIKATPWIGGDTLVQKDLAKTFQMIRDKGRAGFYEGPIADLILAEMKKGKGTIKGIITAEDLKNYNSVWRAPITGNYKKDYRIVSIGPPSSGGVALLQMCEMLEDFPVKEWGFKDARTVHTMIECERLAYADRATHLGDLDYYDVPLKGLLSKEYLSQRAQEIDEKKSADSEQVTAGNPPGAKVNNSGKMPKESNETTHYSIVDKYGNAVSVTTTLNSNYGSKVFVEGGGFLLNNEMDDFSAKPGVPNQFGLVGNEANAIAPGKRMLSSMTPTIVEKKGELYMVLGSPGGATIITSVFQNIINVIEHEMSMQESVNAKRFHHQWLPDVVFTERNAFDEKTIQVLEEMGHHFVERGSLIEKETIGKVDAILVREDNKLEGAGDIRGEDSALGF